MCCKVSFSFFLDTFKRIERLYFLGSRWLGWRARTDFWGRGGRASSGTGGQGAGSARSPEAEDVGSVTLTNSLMSCVAVFQKRMTPCTYLSRKFPTRSKRIDVIARFLFPMGEKETYRIVFILYLDGSMFQCSRLLTCATGYSTCQLRGRPVLSSYSNHKHHVTYQHVMNHHVMYQNVMYRHDNHLQGITWASAIKFSECVRLCCWNNDIFITSTFPDQVPIPPPTTGISPGTRNPVMMNLPIRVPCISITASPSS